MATISNAKLFGATLLAVSLLVAPAAGQAAEGGRGLFGISGAMAGNPKPPNPSTLAAEVTPGAGLWAGPAKTIKVARNWSAASVDRSAAGPFETHERWNDLIMIQEGRGTLVTAALLAGDQAVGDGERRGGAPSGPTQSRPVSPGDVLFIPAGLPHQLLADDGARLRYLEVKTRP